MGRTEMELRRVKEKGGGKKAGEERKGERERERERESEEETESTEGLGSRGEFGVELSANEGTEAGGRG